ncbi:MAG: hypothetical protein HYV65_02810 [Candidatus Spechtbacteria bacterium]|nr:hypothetical protein [Candidatus Spechtbacteria bacterium]
MTKRARTILFLSFVLLFLISVPPVIFYADGYRIDFAHFRIVKVGALRINARPFPANMYVDEKFIESTSFLFRTTFITDLLPQNYLVQVKKDGYQTWQKQLAVYEGSITSATAITLFPIFPLQTIIQSDAVSSGFFPEPKGRAALIAYNAQDRSYNIGAYNSQTHQLLNLDIPNSVGVLTDVVWSNDAKKALLIFTKSNGAFSYIIADNLGETPTITFASSLSTLLPSKGMFSRTQWSNDNSHLLTIVSYTATTKKTQQDLYYIDLDTNTSTKPVRARLENYVLDVKDFLVLQDGIYTIEGAINTMNHYSATLSNRTQISSTPYPVTFNTPSAAFRLIGDSSMIFALHSDGQLLRFNQAKQTFDKIADGVRNIIPAPDGLKVALQKDNEVYLYWVKDINDIPNHKKDDVELIWRLSEPIKWITWLSAPYQYLAIGTTTSLRISELDTRDGRNIVSYKQIAPNSGMVWNDQNQELLLVNKNDFVGVSLDKTTQ